MKCGLATRGAVAVVAALALAACGASGDDGSDGAGHRRGTDSGSSGTPTAKIRGVKAPERFSTDQAIALPESAGAGNVAIAGVQRPLPIALHKGVAYIARPDGMEIASGYVRSDPVRITPKHEPLTTIDDLGPMVGGNPARRPVITQYGGRTLALSSLITRVPGSGTTKGHDEVELMAVDANKATKAWSVEIPLAERYFSVDEGQSEVVGRSGDIVAVLAHGQLFGVDLGSRRKVWVAQGTYAEGAALADSSLVAVRLKEDGFDPPLVGIDPATGKQKWIHEGITVDNLAAAGPDTIITGGYVHDAEDDGALLLDAATGKELRRFPDGTPALGTCAYDNRSTTVCTAMEGVAAYDAATGERRWALPDDTGTRAAPNETLVREGLVYGTTENGPVVLDATTGEDKEDRPGIAPYISDGYVGIALAKKGDSTVTAYRVQG
jgi:hypothetical protein